MSPCRIRILAALLGIGTVGTAAFAGVSFTTPAALNSNAGGDSAQDFMPRVATDRDDTFVVVWASQDTLDDIVGSDHDIFFSRSTDDGATWSNVATLNDDAESDSTSDQGPDLATDGSTWIAVWTSDRNAGGSDGVDTDIFFSRSTDDGAVWSAAAALNTNATMDFADDDSPPRIFTDGAGVWICAWSSKTDLDGNSQSDTDIVYSRSTDDGQTWGAPAFLNSNAPNAVGFDENPYLHAGENGTWGAVWESFDTLGNTIGIDSDVLFARSTDGGQTWGMAKALNSDAATDQGASPIGNDAGMRLLPLGGVNWLATWHHFLAGGGTVLRYSRSTTDGVSWTPLTVLDNPSDNSKAEENGSIGLALVGGLGWIDPIIGDSPGDATVYGIAYGDASVPEPNSAEKLSGNDYDLRFYVADMKGANWTKPEIANPNAFTDSGDDIAPEVAADASGHVVVVWSSFDRLGDTIGSDADILVSTAAVGGLTELLTPNGGEKWKRGKNKNFKWVTNVLATADVRLNLLHKGNKVETITNSTPNDGKFKWKAPANLKKGGGYQVEIRLNADADINDRSYYEFKLK